MEYANAYFYIRIIVDLIRTNIVERITRCFGLYRYSCVFLVLFVLSPILSLSQSSDILITGNKSFKLHIDSLSIACSSLSVQGMDSLDYEYDCYTGVLTFRGEEAPDSVRIFYRRSLISFQEEYYLFDTTLLTKGRLDNPFKFKNPLTESIWGDGISKTGSISRGVRIGNRQNLSVNSNLNLQLSGRVSNDVEILASITDDNIPIQPEGNTAQLQDFDQVYIKLFNRERWSLQAGDIWVNKPYGYFMTYHKRGQGIMFTSKLSPGQNEKNSLSIRGSAALSKGKFARKQIQGVEGNQGPYRLTGADNEPFIVVLSGTEQVFIDGKLLVRGQENDYIINYNTAEVTFTARNLITKDKRIIVEFQYSDKNYARSLIESNVLYSSKKWDFWLNAYSEQDAKNQPLQQDLSEEQRQTLSLAGDDVFSSLASSVDSVGYNENLLLYAQIDTVVNLINYSDVLVYSTSPDSAFFQVFFTNVGQGNGDYQLKELSAFGRVYEWVAPGPGGERNGAYAPVQVLIPPQKRQMLTQGGRRKWDKGSLGYEAAFSNFDQNTFSKLDGGDNQGYAFEVFGSTNKKLDSLNRLKTEFRIERTDKHFSRIQRFRAVEFERNWNVLSLDKSHQSLGMAKISLINSKLGGFSLSSNGFIAGNLYQGVKNDGKFNLNLKGLTSNYSGSYLLSSGVEKSRFYRHKSRTGFSYKTVILTYEDETENNQRLDPSNDGLKQGSYMFYDGKIILGTNDSTRNGFSVYGGQRIDQLFDSSRLSLATRATNLGASFRLQKNRQHQLAVLLNYRELDVQRQDLFNQDNEETVLGRFEYKANIWQGALQYQSFYEIGSGLELRKEFLYLEVQPGQGIYAWIDYDGDNQKDLNEFEIAVFQDQANYIRVFSPTNDYIRTFTNQMNQVLNIRPDRIWRKEDGVKKILSKFSDRAVWRVDKKTAGGDPNQIYNPLVTDISNDELISISQSVRNTLFFQRSHPIFGADYTFQNQSGKTLLTTGFDSRENIFHLVKSRWNLKKVVVLNVENRIGEKSNSADYTQNRDFSIVYNEIKAEIAYQPSTVFRWSLTGSYEEKKNEEVFGGEEAFISDLGTEIRYSEPSKGVIQANFNFISNNYTGENNNFISYEMLDALNPGINYTWGLNFSRMLNKSLQMNINYNGRLSGDNPIIHNGGVQLRAIF